MGQFNQRCLGVLQLRSETYREISDDPGAIRQAAAIVVAVGLIGMAVSYLADRETAGTRIFDKLTNGDSSSAVRWIVSGLLGMFVILAAWWLEAALIRFLGNNLGKPAGSLPLRAVASPLGFTWLISILDLLYGVAFLGAIAGVFSFIWGIAADVTVAKILFSVETGRALVISILSFVVIGIPTVAIFLLTR
jgi:hypothetical protein